MGGCRAAAAADHVDEPFVHPVADQLRGGFGQLVILSQFVGQARIGIGQDQRVGIFRQFGQIGAQQVRAERAIDADRQRLQVPQRIPEGVDRVARQVAARHVGDGEAEHQRHRTAGGGFGFARGHAGGLGIERVEAGFDQQEVDAARDQRVALLAIVGLERIIIDLAIGGIVDIGRDGERLVGRADRSGDEARLAVLRTHRLAGRARQLRGGDIDVPHQMLAAIIGHGDLGRGEGVGLDHVRPRLQIGGVDALDDVGAGEAEKVVIALLVLSEIQVAAIIGFGQAMFLDRSAIAAIEDQDLFRRQGAQLCFGAHHQTPPIEKIPFVLSRDTELVEGCSGRTGKIHHAAAFAITLGRSPSRWQMA